MKIQRLITKAALMTLALTAVLGVSNSYAAPGALAGRWHTGEKNTVVEVSEANGVATGKVISSDDPKGAPGTEVLKNFSESAGVWKGTIYAIAMDKLMDATITPSANSLAISVSVGFIKKKLTWTRVAENPSAD